MEDKHSAISEIKITLDSKNRENNKILINGTDVTNCLKSLNLDIETGRATEFSVKFILF